MSSDVVMSGFGFPARPPATKPKPFRPAAPPGPPPSAAIPSPPKSTSNAVTVGAPWMCPPDVTIIGIDPGLSGYLAGISEDGRTVLWMCPIPTLPTGKGTKRTYDLPAAWCIVQAIPSHVRVLLEQQQCFPKQGGVSNFTLAEGFMLWKALLTAAELSWDMVRPAKWKKAMNLVISAEAKSKGTHTATKARKTAAIVACQREYPGIDLHDDRKTEKSKAPCADKAESVLLALYGKRHVWT